MIKGGYSITPEDIEQEYLTWVKQDEMLIFSHQRFHEKRRFIASLCPKRGNKKYAFNVKNKFDEFVIPFEIEKDRIFRNELNKVNETVTSVLFVTLTYDTKLRDWRSAWSRPYKPHHQSERTKQIELVTGIKKKYKTGIGEDWNRFLSNLKKLYGRVLVARCFESSEKGYPHIHAVLYFPEQEFPTWLRWSFVKKRFIWRIDYEEKQKIQQYYHSSIDVQGMPYLADGMKYISKYISKGSDLKEGHNKTLALNWAFQRRSFSIGKKFKEEIFRRYLALDLTPKIVIQTKVSSQRTLYEKDVNDKISGSKYAKRIDGTTLNWGCIDAIYSNSLMERVSEEKFVCEGVFGRNQLKRLGGVPKNSWSFGCNDKQTVACWSEFYNISPEVKEVFEGLKNPFSCPNGLFDSESQKLVFNGINDRLFRGSPVDDLDWWVGEGQFIV